MTWRDSRVAQGATHHEFRNIPLYNERFDEVLSFHAPGLAAVRRGDEAWHIRIDGSPAYSRRFIRTFGFYEGFAAVVSPDGWHHIRTDGTDIYPARYDWCGNFQDGRCSVRRYGGAYHHITPEGEPSYEARWRYAGDYRYGIAVVQAEDGRSSHIDRDGRLVHGRWFLDLDVFHKGFARARDAEGWSHINRQGQPAYERRFAAVEPFYNGQARVERFDGGLEIIDERGGRLVELRPARKSEFASLSDDLVGFWRTQAICAAVELGVFDALPLTTNGLAQECGLDPGRLHRLLCALSELHLVREEHDTWQTTVRGEYLKTKHPLTLSGAAVEYGRFFPRLWDSLPDAIRADSRWTAPDIFTEVASDNERATAHHRMLMSYALHDYTAVPPALPLKGDESIIDAGGGLGVLADLLVREYPDVKVIVLERPEVVEQAAQRNLGNRVSLRATDILKPWQVEGDAVLMARVLHDWDDHRAVELLRHAHSALPAGGKLFLVEMLMHDSAPGGSLCDLHLLVTTGGRERNEAEYAFLLDEAGFDLDRIIPLPALPSIVVGTAR